ncbi:MAG: PD40 domain-containing protein [Candidatus Zixiibacteriota bacterium]|nr:MAG: PD40 domain-containing protein [candidate division Zixibacteria bacterium]
MGRTCSVFALLCAILYFASEQATAQIPGDANADSVVDVGDVVYQINYLYRSGPEPVFYECGDPNADCVVDVGDIVYLVNYLFREGSDPEIVYCDWTEPVNVGLPINSPEGEGWFRMTPDGRMAVFVSNREGTYGNGDIWHSFWDSVSGTWSEPQNCGPNVNTMIEDLGPCLSPDGKKLYYVQFERLGGYGGWDIWVSSWDSLNSEWGELENLGPTINSFDGERSPFVSPDGSDLYFRNSWGIWVSEWNGSAWETPIWLDTTVNVWLTEMDPSVTAHNKTLYFTRYYYDWQICVSRWTGTAWGSPQVLGPQINDPSGALQPYISPDGTRLYFISPRPGGLGSTDVWVSERIVTKKKEQLGEAK